MKRDFLVVSFQKRLVEQVIDAWKQKKTLAQLDTFHFTNEKNVKRIILRFMSVGRFEPHPSLLLMHLCGWSLI